MSITQILYVYQKPGSLLIFHQQKFSQKVAIFLGKIDHKVTVVCFWLVVPHLRTCHELSYDAPIEAVVCKFTFKNNQSLIVCSAYRPPDRILEAMESLCQLFESICSTYPETPIWITGDMNLPNINWETFCVSC